MDEFDKLNEEQLQFLEKIRPDFRELPFEDFFEWLTYYFQEHGLDDIENNPEQLFLENIICDLCDGVDE